MIDPKKIQVLLVEDNPTDALVVEDELAHAGSAQFAVEHVEQLKEALAMLVTQRFDVVLLDLSLPDSHGFETFTRLHDEVPEMPIVVLSGRADEELAVKAVQAGAQDYLVKGRTTEDVLPRSIRYAIERQRSEKTLAESEARYRLLIEQSPNGYLVHCDGKIVFANAAALKLFGAAAPKLLLGRSVLDVFSPEFHDDIRHRVRDAHAGGSNTPMEILGVRLDGTTVALEETSNPFLHEGRPAMQVVLHDLTERKRAEARFRWVVDSNAQGVMFWNTSGEITGANDAFLQLTGYTREDLDAGHMNWEAMTPPEFASLDRHALKEIATRGTCTPYEKKFLRKDGTLVPLLLGAAVFEDNPEQGVCFTVDLTERKKLEQRFLRVQRMESIGTLASGIAHDLNNILAPIMMSVPMLRRNLSPEDREGIISTVETSAERGAQIVKQVLTFGRGVEGVRRPLQIGALIGEIVKITRGTFPKDITVESDIEPGLWPVLGDATQIHQVLLNLCINARDAMPSVGRLCMRARNLEIDAGYASMLPGIAIGSHVLIEVSDSGTGIPLEIIDRIFDPFFTTKGIGEGTGLGLSTVLGIVKSHDGHIDVKSAAGRGTTFQIYLPASPGMVEDPGNRDLLVEAPDGHSETLLVVDDEVAVLCACGKSSNATAIASSWPRMAPRRSPSMPRTQPASAPCSPIS
jgi:PAS domain S-box-containing protein